MLRFTPLLLVVFLFVFTACAQAATTNKETICHYTNANSGNYKLIRISQNGLMGHNRHTLDLIPSPNDQCIASWDHTSPELFLPSNIEVAAQDASGAVVFFTVTAVDNVDGEVDVDCAPLSGSVFPIGTTTVYCTAADLAGNTSTGSFEIKVVS